MSSSLPLSLQDPNASESEFNSTRDSELLPIQPGEPEEVKDMTRLMRRCVVRDPQQRPSLKELVAEVTRLRDSLAAHSGGNDGVAGPSANGNNTAQMPSWQAVAAGRMDG